MTKDPKTQEFIMITQYGNQGDLRTFLTNNYNNLLWKDKIELQKLIWMYIGILLLPLSKRRRALAHLEREVSRLSMTERN